MLPKTALVQLVGQLRRGLEGINPVLRQNEEMARKDLTGFDLSVTSAWASADLRDGRIATSKEIEAFSLNPFLLCPSPNIHQQFVLPLPTKYTPPLPKPVFLLCFRAS